jgi:1-phosphofructokinase
VSCDFVTTQAITRENIKIRDGSGQVTELNEPGQPISEHEMELLIAKLLYRGRRNSFFVLAGCLPESSSPDTYRNIIQKIKNTKSHVLLDTEGEALQEGINAGVDLLKLNRYEFCDFLGEQTDASEKTLYQGARELCGRGVGIVVVTLGHDGAMFVTREEVYRVTPPRVTVKSTVGAGDCMMGALAYGLEQGLNLPQIVRLSSAASVGAVMLPGTDAPGQALIEEIAPKLVIQKGS